MRFNFVLLSAVLPVVLLVAGAPVTSDGVLEARTVTKADKTTGATTANAQTGPAAKKAVSCPAKSKTKRNIQALGRRAPIIIGYTGTDDVVAAKLRSSATRTDNNAARLGTGLYLTDNLKLRVLSWAEVFADKAKKAGRSRTPKKAYVCRISIDEATWTAMPKIWIPNTNGMIDTNPTSGAEGKRKAYEAQKCVESPAVRFSTYAVTGAPPNSHELVIPPNLQRGFRAECHEVPQSTAIDSDDETPMYPALGYTYKTKASAWGIAGDVQ